MKTPLSFPLWTGFALVLAAVFALWPAISDQTQGAIIIGDIFVVNSTGDGNDAFPGDGNCEIQVGNGVCTLRAALQEVNARKNGGDGISFSIPSTDPDCTGGVCFIQPFNGGLPDVSVGVDITGPGANNLIIDGGGDARFGHRVFNVTTTGTVSISGLTIANGFTDNAQYGAGLQNVNGGTINISNCTFSRNQSHVGTDQYNGGAGAIYNAGSGTINITSCTFKSNSGDTYGLVTYGGAIWNKSGTIHVSNSTFDHNQSSYYGGAIWNDSGTVTVTGSTFRQNGAALGGAIASFGGTVSVTNSTFYENIAYRFADAINTGVGGAICNFNKAY